MDLSSLPAIVASAFFVSFATVVIPSPSTLAASRYAVTQGTRAAAACLSAVVILDTIVFLALALGLQPWLRSIGGSQYMPPVAGALLVLAGIAMVIAAPKDVSRLVSRRGKRFADREQALHGPFISGLLIPLANPGYWIWWTTVGTAFIHAARHWGRLGLTIVLLGFLAGVLSWYLPLLYALHRGRQVFSPSAQQRLLTLVGVAMIGFGLFLLWHSFIGIA
jgi:threonine/homoserine/homoserine lactone efflux protein